MTVRLALLPGLITLGAVLGSCAPRQAAFVEPAWGDAPAPYPAEITEITYEYRHCDRNASGCSLELATLRRDSRASRTVHVGQHEDTVQTGTIDSLAFATLAEHLIQEHFFRGLEGYARHEPLSTDSYILSVASLCRRAVRSYARPESSTHASPEYLLAVQGALQGVRWAYCCEAHR